MDENKKGTYDFAFNLQEIMTENHIILTGILLTQSNDRKTIKNVLNDIYETIKLFIEMQREFGERKKYSEIRRRIRELQIQAISQQKIFITYSKIK